KDAVTARLAAPLLAALAAPNAAAWWRSRPASLGGECDALAVTPAGDLLTIEIKPAKATNTIAWAPLQGRHYANLFAEWVRQEPRDGSSAAEILQGMVDQRVQL